MICQVATHLCGLQNSFTKRHKLIGKKSTLTLTPTTFQRFKIIDYLDTNMKGSQTCFVSTRFCSDLWRHMVEIGTQRGMLHKYFYLQSSRNTFHKYFYLDT